MMKDAQLNSIKLLRLNKFLAKAGVCSRRAADDAIAHGRVTINGTLVSLGATVDSLIDRVTIDGKPVNSPRPSAEHVYLALYKPPKVITTVSDPQRRTTVLDLLPSELRRSRPFPVGRLDFLSEGLLLLTTDGDMAMRLSHPRWHLPKCYHVWIKGPVPADHLSAISAGMVLAEGDCLAPVQARTIAAPFPLSLSRRPIPSVVTCLELTLVQGVNRQIRRMCRDLSLPILRLIRVSQGPIKLGSLSPSCVHSLTPVQLTALRAAVGLRQNDQYI
ncbi:23S rRNA pseudouridine2605 synthase [Desulfovibrionales bacterium]